VLGHLPFILQLLVQALTKRTDTVGELGRADNCVSDVAFLQAHDAGNTYAERLAWEGENRFANSIRTIEESLEKMPSATPQRR
jgi:hypothetical protein